MRRGDTLQFGVEVRRRLPGSYDSQLEYCAACANSLTPAPPQDLTGWFLWCTVKRSTSDPDQLAVAQVTTQPSSVPAGGGIGVVAVQLGQAQVSLPPIATRGFPNGDTVLEYDVQGRDASNNVFTLETGRIVVAPDVTNAIAVPTVPPTPPNTNVYAVVSSVATTALLSQIPNSILLPQGVFAAVQSRQALFTYAPTDTQTPNGSTIVAGLGGGNWLWHSTLNPYLFLAQALWFVDRVNGSNDNTGLTSTTAVQHKAEILRRWGPVPTLDGLDVVIEYLSPDVDGSDPGIFIPTFANGATLTHTAPLPAPTFAGTIATLVAKNTGAKQALNASFTVTSGALAQGMLLVNSTRGSRCEVVRLIAGSTWLLTQPVPAYDLRSVLPLPLPQDDTWAVTDQVVGYVPMAVNLTVLGGRTIDLNQARLGCSHIATQLTIYAPGAFEPLLIDQTGMVGLGDVVVRRAITAFGARTPSLFRSFVNCFFFQQISVQVEGINFVAGCLLNGGICDYGTAFGGNIVICNTLTSRNSDMDDAELYVDTGAIFNSQGRAFIAGGTVLGKVYGPGTFNVHDGTVEYHETAGSHFLCTLTIGGSALAYSVLTTGGSVVMHQLALTAAALDVAAGPIGFGGLAFVPGVGSFHFTGATP